MIVINHVGPTRKCDEAGGRTSSYLQHFEAVGICDEACIAVGRVGRAEHTSASQKRTGSRVVDIWGDEHQR